MCERFNNFPAKKQAGKSVHGDMITGYFILVSLSLLVGKDSTDGVAKNY